MAKIITKTPIEWGGWNPQLKNKIQVTMRVISKNDNGLSVEIKDNVMVEDSYINEQEEEVTFLKPIQNIRTKQLNITVEQYNNLYGGAEHYISQVYNGITPFEKDKIIESVALLIFMQTDVLDNNKCLYNTSPNDWVISK